VSLIRRNVLQGIQRVLVAAMVVIVLAIVTLGVRAIWAWRQPASDGLPAASPPAVADAPIPTAIPMMTSLPARTRAPSQASTQAPGRPGTSSVSVHKVGIVAGHWQNDSGAVCADGLQEVDINLAVAQRVVSLLSLAGYHAEILAEFSPKLDGYEASALISIHADSCSVPGVSGFKVASVSSSLVPELEARLVACLIDRYQEATGLRFHRDTITFDMTEYHAFYEIAPETPGAIIEIGFMDADRSLLTQKQDLVAAGIANGIKCFIESAY
jgi:N-acetylmuramoyl-L-alanine amidase